jgi:hypothetical protein
VRVLFDQGVPVPLRESLRQHEVSTAYERGWATLKNGELLDAAEREGFEILVTTDKNLRHQQNLGARRIAIVVLTSTSWPRIQPEITAVVRAVNGAYPGSYAEVQILWLANTVLHRSAPIVAPGELGRYRAGKSSAHLAGWKSLSGEEVVRRLHKG